ncbi:MAG: hypothetical protein JWN39_933 [Ilumatobacteraceae bacterium]|nr:hypothetical protein [Ilumatobacteraceae bacterium]
METIDEPEPAAAIPSPPTVDEPGWPVAPAPHVAVLPPLQPGQLSPGWRMVFISGWIGVLAGFGALWQAGRLAGIAPWWLGPETNLRPIYVIALPYVAPLIAVVFGFIGHKWACFVGIAASIITAAFALGDLHFPGLAVVDALIGICGLFVSIACLGGRMRAVPEPAPSDTETETAVTATV